MCDALDPLTHLECLRAPGHNGEHVAMGYDAQAHWTVAWSDPEIIRRQLAAALRASGEEVGRR
jgi:hypothetical protein